MKTSRLLACFAIAGMTLLPSAALAHPGAASQSGFVAGLVHPFTGADHLAAMLAVGLLAGLASGRALWLFPAGFVTAMLVGAGTGLAGWQAPAVEGVILASVIGFGAATMLRISLPTGVMLAVVAFFGFFHGFAHGQEAPLGGVASYIVGFTFATAALHLVGTLIGRNAPVLATRAVGAAVLLLGIGLAALA